MTVPRDMDNPLHLLDESMSSEVDSFALQLYTDDLLAEDQPGLDMDVDKSCAESCCELAPPTSPSIPTTPDQEQESVQDVTPDQEQESVQDVTPPSTSTTPTPTSRLVPCTFKDTDIRERGHILTKEECHRINLDKATRAKARGKAELTAQPRTVTFKQSSASSTSSSRVSTCRSSSTPPSRAKSLVSHLPLPTPDLPPAQPSRPILKRTTRCQAYLGLPVGSEEYGKLQPLMAPPAPPAESAPASQPRPSIKSRLGYKQTNSIKSRLGTRSLHRTSPSSQAPLPSTSTSSPTTPAPASAPTSSRTGSPAHTSGNITYNKTKRHQRPNQKVRRE